MAQKNPSNPETERHMWIQLKKQITLKDWNYKALHWYVLTAPQPPQAYLSYPNHNEWGFQTEITFQPKLTKVNSFAASHGWTCYHKKVTLDIFMKFSDITNHVDLRVCYIPKSALQMEMLLHNAGKNLVNASAVRKHKSYVWIFDICLIKMIFRDQNDPARSITKNFHLDSTSGTCKREDHADDVEDEFAHFKNSDFIAKVDLESLAGHKLEFGDTSFLPVDFELRARLRLCPLNKDKEMMEPDDRCILASSKKMEPIYSSKLDLSSALHPPFPQNDGNKPKLLHMDYDVTFEIKCESEVSTILKAHSWILVAQSPVFFKMLTTDMLEKKRGIIEMEHGTTPESLALFLTCLYERMGLSYSENRDFKSLDEWTPELSFQTLQLAHKYQVTELQDLCIESIISRPDSEFTTELTVKMFKAGMLYETDDLRQRSVDWIKRQTRERVKVELNELLKNEESNIVTTQILLSLI